MNKIKKAFSQERFGIKFSFCTMMNDINQFWYFEHIGTIQPDIIFVFTRRRLMRGSPLHHHLKTLNPTSHRVSDSVAPMGGGLRGPP